MLYRLAIDSYRGKILFEQTLFRVALLGCLSLFCDTGYLLLSPLRTNFTLGYGAGMEWRDVT